MHLKKDSSTNQQMKGGVSNPEVLRDILKYFAKSSTTSTTTTTINMSKMTFQAKKNKLGLSLRRKNKIFGSKIGKKKLRIMSRN